MASLDVVLALVKAHYRRDEPLFRTFVMQAASHIKDERKRAELVGHVTTMAALPMGLDKYFVRLPKVTLGELLLAPDVVQTLVAVSCELQHRAAMLERNVPPRSRLLFHGPPGNGKSSAAVALAGLLGVEAFGVTLSAIVDSFLGATAANLSKAFEALHEGATVVFDELDAVGAARTGGGGAADKERNSTVNTLLTLMDRENGGVLIATTNRPDMLDPALLRRFDEQIEFAPPTVEQQSELAWRLVRKYGLDASSVGRFVGCFAADGACSYKAVADRVLAEARKVVLADIVSGGSIMQGEAAT